MEARLREKGIATVEKLCSLSAAEMRRAWDSVLGEELWRLLRGEDPAAELSAKRSIGHSHVPPPAARTERGAFGVLSELTDKAALRLRREGFFASGLRLYVGFTGRPAWQSRRGFMETRDTPVFLDALRTLWKGFPGGPVYSVGMALTGLAGESLREPSLFDDPRGERLTRAFGALNDRYGRGTLHYGAAHGRAGAVPLRISFTRIPGGHEVKE